MSVKELIFNQGKYVLSSSGNYKLIALGDRGVYFADGSTLFKVGTMVAYGIYHPEGDKDNNYKPYYDLKHFVAATEQLTSDNKEKLSDESLAKSSVKVYSDNAIEIGGVIALYRLCSKLHSLFRKAVNA